MPHLKTLLWKMVLWLRANPLGPALTVCLSGLVAVFALPQFTVWLLGAPKLVLIEVLLSAPFVPYAVHRVHNVSWKPLAALWALVYLGGIARPPAPLKVMHALAISAHMTAWFMWGFVLTAALAMILGDTKSGAAAPDTAGHSMSTSHPSHPLQSSARTGS